MTRRNWWASALLAAAVGVASPGLAQQVTTGGKNAVFVAQAGDLDFIEFQTTLPGAKRSQILKLDAFFKVGGGGCGLASQACISVVTVNDQPVQPSQFGACAPCSSLGCTVSGSFWFDPEAAGQSGVPLDLRVVLADGGLQCVRQMEGTLSAILVKK